MPTIEPPSRPVLTEAVRLGLLEDLRYGDVTTEACVPPDATGRARVVARKPVRLCGLALLEEVYRQLDSTVAVERQHDDGTDVAAGATVARVRGPARSLLLGERLALNFLQHLSGVATLTARFVAALPEGSTTRICGTRKTLPGLRALQRWAIRCGGGSDHRPDLGAAPLVKDNHVAAAGGITAAIEAVRRRAPHGTRVACEVDDLAQLREALAAGADVVLLDNFSDAQVAEALEVVAGRAVVEVSGGLTVERVPALARLGVDVLSVGALTHSAAAVDLGLDWEASG